MLLRYSLCMVARIDTRLGQILRAEGRTQSWLARTVGVDRTLINRYVHGIHLPGQDMQAAIASALGRQVVDVFPDSQGEVSTTSTCADDRVGTEEAA